MELCRRHKRNDLGKKAYQIVLDVEINPNILKPFGIFAPPPKKPPAPPPPTTPNIQSTLNVEKEPIEPRKPFSPELAPRLAHVNAQLADIQSASDYINKKQIIDEFVQIFKEMNPSDSDGVVELINNINDRIGSFTTTKSRDTQQTLYNSTIEYENRLALMLADCKKSAVLRPIADMLNPYFGALELVVSDLSKQAGITPEVEAIAENTFLSLETPHSTLVLRITNTSERRVTDITVRLLAETHEVTISDDPVQMIDTLAPMKSALLNFPIEMNDTTVDGLKEITFSAILRASSEGFDNFEMRPNKLIVPVKTFSEVVNGGSIVKAFQFGTSLKPIDHSQDLFQGRDDVLNRIKGSFHGGIQSERYFLDGIRRVGKTSIINFLPTFLPEHIIPVFIDFDTQSLGVRGPINSSMVLQDFCNEISKNTLKYTGTQLPEPDSTLFEQNAGKAFQNFLTSFKRLLPNKTPLLMLDEFQDLLISISKTGPSEEQDKLVLDQLRGLMDQGHLYMIYSGSIRFDRLSNIVHHRIFGSLKRLPISFLSNENVGNVLRAGFEEPVKIPSETIKCIAELTGGYPWLVQLYGSSLVDHLNDQRRIIATPEDVKLITDHVVLPNAENFKYWWDKIQLGRSEESFIERLLSEFPDDDTVTKQGFFEDIHINERTSYMNAFQKLKSCEVLDSTQTSILKIRGKILKLWLKSQMQADKRLRVREFIEDTPVVQGKTGFFVDHENLIKSLERISESRGIDVPEGQAKVLWLSDVLKQLLEEAKQRSIDIDYKVSVAFWSRPHEAALISAYFSNGF